MPDTRWKRLRRHGAFHAAVILASTVWLGLQGADVFGAPVAWVRVLGLGFVLVFAVLAGYAWLDTREVKAGSGKTPGMVRRRWQAVVVAAITLLLLSGGTWWLRPHLFGAVRPGADVIAVLPFSASGPSVGLLGEGLVDLLSANLNEVGHVRTIDPRTTLHNWKQVAVTGTVDLDGALEVGRAVGAGSVLLGSVVEAGGTVRLSAELVSVDGGKLASAAREGAADSVFELVDGLSVDLLRDVWRAHEPLPAFRLSAITTSSPEALRAYMQGEQHFRRSQFDSARTSYEHALQEDSTFALAHFRMSEVYGWTDAVGGVSVERPYAEAATRFADRLPKPEQSLISARALQLEQNLAAVDTLRAFVARYPDDATGWYSLADAQFHAWRLLDVTGEKLYQGFDRALELDPSFVPALLHPLELSVMLGDSARFQRYLGAFRGVESAGQVAVYRTAGVVRWSPPSARLETFHNAIRDEAQNPAINRGSSLLKLLSAHTAAVLADTIPEYEKIHAAYDIARAALPSGSPFRLSTYVSEALTAASMGQFQSARALLDTIWSIDVDPALLAALPVYLWGARPPDYGEREVQRVVETGVGVAPHTLPYWRALFAFKDGRTAQAERILDDAGQPSDSRLAPVADALRTLIRIAEGDAATDARNAESMIWRHREIEAGLGRIAYYSRSPSLVNTLRTQLAVLRATQPETRDAAIRHLRLLSAFEPYFSLLLAPQLAEAYEHAGMRAEAARTWGRYIAVLERGDPEIEPYLDAARRALERLVAEEGPA